jgi:GPH family glycoside/pentoside/hexuronide:cation symporter
LEQQLDTPRPGLRTRLSRWFGTRSDADEPSPKELASYSVGGVGMRWSEEGIKQFSNQIWVLNLGLNPATLGIIAAVKTVWDGINDTLFGYVTDNTKTRWGRRRPYILVGGVLYGLLLIAYWWFNPQWPLANLLIWYTVFLFLIEGAQTIFGIPYYALGIEMSPSYHGKTRVIFWREYLSRIGHFATPWFKAFALMGAFGGIVYGARAVCAVLGVVVICTSVFSAVVCRERKRVASNKKREPFFRAIRQTASSGLFWRILAIYIIMLTKGPIFDQFGNYIAVGYVFQGNQKLEAFYAGWNGMTAAVMGLVGLPVTAWISRRIGKHRTLAIMVCCLIVGTLLKLVLMDPQRPWLILFTPFPYVFGIVGLYTILGAMQADLVEVDELRTGVRREGMFGAVQSIVMKASSSLSIAVAGFVVIATGFNPETRMNQTPETYKNMMFVAYVLPNLLLALVLLLLWRYPLTEARMADVRDQLKARQAASQPTNPTG